MNRYLEGAIVSAAFAASMLPASAQADGQHIAPTTHEAVVPYDQDAIAYARLGNAIIMLEHILLAGAAGMAVVAGAATHITQRRTRATEPVAELVYRQYPPDNLSRDELHRLALSTLPSYCRLNGQPWKPARGDYGTPES